MKNRANPYAKPDAKTLEARAKGYPARSVFKLQEIDRRMRLLRAGQNVLDLGAAPGSWSLFASERVGPTGHVYAIDIKPMLQVFGENVKVLEGDALSLESEVLAAHAPYDVVLSDMAPNTSGSKFQDQARSTELFLRALEVALAHGKPGSHFVAKIFMNGDFKAGRDAGARGLRERAHDSPRRHPPGEHRGVRRRHGQEGLRGAGAAELQLEIAEARVAIFGTTVRLARRVKVNAATPRVGWTRATPRERGRGLRRGGVSVDHAAGAWARATPRGRGRGAYGGGT